MDGEPPRGSGGVMEKPLPKGPITATPFVWVEPASMARRTIEGCARYDMRNARNWPVGGDDGELYGPWPFSGDWPLAVKGRKGEGA